MYPKATKQGLERMGNQAAQCELKPELIAGEHVGGRLRLAETDMPVLIQGWCSIILEYDNKVKVGCWGWHSIGLAYA